MAKVVASLPILAKEGSLDFNNLMKERETKLTILWTKNKLILKK
jgi:hypothetical protein